MIESGSKMLFLKALKKLSPNSPSLRIGMKNIQPFIDELKSNFPRKDAAVNYITFHEKRYTYIISEIDQIINEHLTSNAKILDIGPAYQTNLLRSTFPESTINTIGFDLPVNNLRPHEKHLVVDLNKTEEFDGSYEQHDLILFAEVIEHLYTRPQIVINFLTKFLKPGGFLIIQTPNAAASFKRLQLLLGVHPYEQIQENRMGHYREYMAGELKQILKQTGFETYRIHIKNYFNYQAHFYQKVYRGLNLFMPSNFKDGITIIGRKVS